MIARSPLPERDYDPAKIEPSFSESEGTWIAPRSKTEHISVEVLSSPEGGYDHALQFMLSKAQVEPSSDALDLLSKLDGLRLAGEYLFIARPLIYGIHFV